MGVQEVGGPVQGHHGLSGSWPALHGVDAGQRCPDNVVLLSLDRPDDVAQPTGAGRLEGGDQGSLSLQAVSVAVPEPLRVAEQLVLDAHYDPAAADQVPAPFQAHGHRTGGPVEGLGDWGPPVHDHRILVDVPDPDSTDVKAAAAGLGLLVDATEDQRGVAHVQLPQTSGYRVPDGLALEASLVGAPLAHLDHGSQLQGPVAGGLETRIGVVDVGLFGVHLGVFGGHQRAYGGRWTMSLGYPGAETPKSAEDRS